MHHTPYYDDLDVDKNFTKIVALPGRVEQAREFTQIQTMTHNQIEDLFDTIYADGKVLSGCILNVNSTKTAASISPGKIYAYGRAWNFEALSEIPITGVGTEIIGVILQELIITELDDPTLLDPAAGYTNYMQPGAHRLRQIMVWSLISDSGLGIFTLIDGALPNNTSIEDPKPKPQTVQILDMIAQRDYERLGNYVISGLTVTITDHPTDPWNKKRVVVKSGTASLRGYDVILYQDWYDDLLLARDTNVINGETWIYSAYNPVTRVGGERILAESPVAAVNSVVATVLAVDGYEERPYIRRGTAGGLDALSEVNVQDIVAVNQGGTWDPISETFIGGTDYQSPRDYSLSGNSVSWASAATGATEPEPTSSYSCAYRYRKTLSLEIVQMAAVTNELRTNNDSGGNTLTHSYVCETNDYTGISITISDTSGGTPAYSNGTDFNVDLGVIDWYSHEVQILEITKGAANGIDNLTGFSNSYTMGDILSVAFYTNPASQSYNESTNTFVDADVVYDRTTDWLNTTGVAQINWSPVGSEPSLSATYFVAVRARKYLTGTHPGAGATFYVNYHYWSVITPGDYLARNSFYTNYVGPGNPLNVPQRYGLDLQNSVNFWRSTNNQIIETGQLDKPYPGREMLFIYEYYLPRYAIVSFNATDGVVITYGNSSTKPKEPIDDKNNMSVNLALLYCPADSIYIYNRPFGVQTVKVSELHSLLDRTDLVEKQIAQTWLELHAKSLPVPNKLGILTVSFTSLDKIDPGYPGTTYSIDPTWQQLALPHTDSFHSLTIDEGSSNTQTYKTITTLVPNGSNFIEQTNYTGTESIAPYALAAQTSMLDIQSAVLNLSPISDTLVIPRLQVFASVADATAWNNSDVSKLTNPTAWFTGGWSSGGWISRDNAPAQGWEDQQTITYYRSYIRDIVRMCRQIQVTWSVPGGLIPSTEAELDYFIYFGGVLLTPTLNHSTPSGAAPNSFRPNLNRGAGGTFMIPPNIPEGKVEVRITSSPMTINGNIWRQNIVATFESSVQELLVQQATECRCFCYCNCWCNCNCWCAGGSGPLAETLEPTAKSQRFLKDVTIDFAMVHPTYGNYVSIIKTDNGQPVTETIQSAMVARQYMTAAQLAGGGMKTFLFDDPVFQEDDTYAIKINGEDWWNHNSIAEIAAGRDIRVKIAKMGRLDIPSGITVGTQPFKDGVMWRSLTGISWEQDQMSDLKFKASYYEYPVNQEKIVYLNPVTVSNATAFILNWNSTQLEHTSIVFEYRTDSGLWTEFTPFQLTFMDEITNEINFRSKLKSTNKNVTPFVENTAGLYVQATQDELLIATNEFDTGGVDCTNLDVWCDSYLPSGSEQILAISFNGTDWTILDNPLNNNPTGNLVDFSVVNYNNNNITIRYHWLIELTSPNVFTKFIVRINSTVSGPTAQLKDPRFSNLVAIASI